MVAATDEQAVPATDYIRPSRNTWYDEISIKWRSKTEGNEHQEPCYFLEKLPAELRNRIYRDVLVPRERKPIEITRQAHPYARLRSPGLLRTCKQIKGEATKMWLTENRFEIHIRNCDASVLKKFFSPYEKAISELRDTGVALDIQYHVDGANWKNLIIWCKYVHKTRIGYSRCFSHNRRYEAFVDAALVIAGAERQPSWEYCQKALEGLRGLVGYVSGEWLRDEVGQKKRLGWSLA